MTNRIWKLVLVGATILASGLLVSACGTSTSVTSMAPIKVNVSNAHGSKQPAPIASVNAVVASSLKTSLHLKRVVIDQGPPDTTGLQAFLDNPTTATANAINTGPTPLGANGWLFMDGVATLPTYSSANAEIQSIGQLAQSSIAGLPAIVRSQIVSSKTVYVDFAYGKGGKLAYIVFWWGNPQQQ